MPSPAHYIMNYLIDRDKHESSMRPDTVKNIVACDTSFNRIVNSLNILDWEVCVDNLEVLTEIDVNNGRLKQNPDPIKDKIVIHNDRGGNPNPKFRLDEPSLRIYVVGLKPPDNDATDIYNMARRVKNYIHGLHGVYFKQSDGMVVISDPVIYHPDGKINTDNPDKADLLIQCLMQGDINKIGSSVLTDHFLYSMLFSLTIQLSESSIDNRVNL